MHSAKNHFFKCSPSLISLTGRWVAVLFHILMVATLLACGGGVSGGGTGGSTTTPPAGGTNMPPPVIPPTSPPVLPPAGTPTVPPVMPPAGTPTVPPLMPPASPAASFGSVVGLGSIFVGPYEFDDELQKITSQDGLPVRASDLGLGSQVTVVNNVVSQTLSLSGSNPVASVQIKRMFLGVLQASSDNLDKFILNGQKIYTDRRTILIGAGSIAGLVNTQVQVAGYLEPGLNIVIATRIEPATPEQVIQNQIYLSARVQAVDATNSTVSVGFANINLSNVPGATLVQVNDIIRVQGTITGINAGVAVVAAGKLSQLKPVAGAGDVTFRGIVNSRPTTQSPTLALIVDGYEVQLVGGLNAVNNSDLRRGSLVEIRGRLDTLTVKNANLEILANPAEDLVGEPPVIAPPISNPGLEADYKIFRSPIQSINADGSLVVRGQRVVVLREMISPPPPPLVVGQIISVEGEARLDTQGFYLEAILTYQAP
jgi:Domain of unknown function (DUF5666)